MRMRSVCLLGLLRARGVSSLARSKEGTVLASLQEDTKLVSKSRIIMCAHLAVEQLFFFFFFSEQGACRMRMG